MTPNTPHTVGHVGWSPDYKSTPMPPATGTLIARRSAAACSRIADPEGKHLEVCRLQLASVVADRDKYKAAYEVAIYNLIGVAGHGHPGVKQATDIVDYSENVRPLATPPLTPQDDDQR